MISVTQLSTQKKITLDPEIFIIHQPRRTALFLPGKKPFRETTIMSAFTPQFCFQVQETYEQIVPDIIKGHPGDFIEWTHGETGTRFCLCPRMFALFEPGCASGFATADGGMELTDRTSIVSVMNPAVWVPLKESYEEARDKYRTAVLSWSLRSGPHWGKKNDA